MLSAMFSGRHHQEPSFDGYFSFFLSFFSPSLSSLFLLSMLSAMFSGRHHQEPSFDGFSFFLFFLSLFLFFLSFSSFFQCLVADITRNLLLMVIFFSSFLSLSLSFLPLSLFSPHSMFSGRHHQEPSFDGDFFLFFSFFCSSLSLLSFFFQCLVVDITKNLLFMVIFFSSFLSFVPLSLFSLFFQCLVVDITRNLLFSPFLSLSPFSLLIFSFYYFF